MRTPITKLEITCGFCGTKFEAWPSQRAKFCSPQCFYANSHTAESVSERFWKFVSKSETCWLWCGCKTKTGYGKCAFKGESQLTHRISYEIAYGEIPDGMQVLHKCDIYNCVRPDHLFLGTNSDNRADSVKKDRHARGERMGFNKLMDHQVVEIKSRISQGQTHESIAKLYGVCRPNITMIANGKNWKHIKVS